VWRGREIAERWQIKCEKDGRSRHVREREVQTEKERLGYPPQLSRPG